MTLYHSIRLCVYVPVCVCARLCALELVRCRGLLVMTMMPCAGVGECVSNKLTHRLANRQTSTLSMCCWTTIAVIGAFRMLCCAALWRAVPLPCDAAAAAVVTTASSAAAAAAATAASVWEWVVCVLLLVGRCSRVHVVVVISGGDCFWWRRCWPEQPRLPRSGPIGLRACKIETKRVRQTLWERVERTHTIRTRPLTTAKEITTTTVFKCVHEWVRLDGCVRVWPFKIIVTTTAAAITTAPNNRIQTVAPAANDSINRIVHRGVIHHRQTLKTKLCLELPR